MSNLRKRLAIFAAISVVLWTGAASSEDGHMDRYVGTLIAVQDATLDGARQRLAALRQRASRDNQFDLDAFTQARVLAIYRRNGFTPSSHLLYGTREREGIDVWLATRPDLQERLDLQRAELSELIEKMNEEN